MRWRTDHAHHHSRRIACGLWNWFRCFSEKCSMRLVFLSIVDLLERCLFSQLRIPLCREPGSCTTRERNFCTRRHPCRRPWTHMRPSQKICWSLPTSPCADNRACMKFFKVNVHAPCRAEIAGTIYKALLPARDEASSAPSAAIDSCAVIWPSDPLLDKGKTGWFARRDIARTRNPV